MSEKCPTVSVIIPSYNREHQVGRAIQSVLDQTYKDFEIIVIDDGSIDNTEKVVKSFNDERVKYIRQGSNGGAAAARNTGIKIAQGEYIAFQDSDDEWFPEKLEKQMKVFEDASPEVGVVYTGMWKINREKRKYWYTPRIKPEDGIVYEEALNRVRGIGLVAAVIKRECFNKVGVFDESLPRFIDLEFFIRLSQYYLFQHIDEPLVNYYHTENSISSNTEVLITTYEQILKKHSYKIIGNRKSWASFQYLIGNTLCQTGNLVQGRGYLLRAVKSHPLGIKCMVAVFLSLFGRDVYVEIVRSQHKCRILSRVLPPVVK
ncbi:MAG: glycosyltransferase [Anaerolineales bacterium]|nr:glycosyltransferase [Anaerolineales bacterium]